jgi:two-component system cell cycle sensor histidine kinase/response regulator CckA
MPHSADSKLVPEEMAERAELFRVFAETSHDLIRLIEIGGRVVYASPSVIRFLGKYPAHQFENIHPDDLEGAQRWWAQLLAGGSDLLEWRVRDVNGDWHSLETWAALVQYHGSEHALTFCRDVTERVRILDSLRESQRKLEDAQEIAHIGYWGNDIEADRIEWSDEVYRILGIEPSKDPPTIAVLQQLIHPDDRQRQAQASEVAKRGGGRYDVEYRVIRPDGEVRTLHSIGDMVLDKSGKPLRSFGVVQDITAQKAAEHALRESHGLLNAIVEGTSDAVFVKNTEGRYLLMNATGARFLDKTAADIIGHTDRELFTADIADALMERDQQVIASGSSQTFEEEHTVAGAMRTYVVTKSAYRDWNGKVIGLIGISSDVTELKRLEKQFREAQKMEAVGRLAGGVAHDFNNLLTVINSYSEMMLADMTREHPDREALTEIRKAGDRAANLTHQLLAFSRNQILQPRVVNLNKTLPDLIKLLRRLIGEDVELVFEADRGLCLTKVDPMQLDQAIVNLAVNARDSMSAGGRLTIKTRNVKVDDQNIRSRAAVRAGEYVEVCVSDTGHGMDEATQARVFEPFFTTKQPGKGTGLGLAMVYGFVKQSGGHIEMESKLGKGTTFRIYLPRSVEPGTATAAEGSQLSPRGTETVLLVEDEEAVRTLTKRVLESRGYKVMAARDGQEGLTMAKEFDGAIDMLVTDLVMPRMSGRDLADELVKSRPAIRVLFMSGYTDESMLPRAVVDSQGIFLQKPFSPTELAQKVREILDRA